VSERGLHIAWLGPVPGGDAGVTGVNAELLHGLARLGHRIDCFFPSAGHPIPPDLVAEPSLTFIWGTSQWQWDRWYSRNKVAAFASGLLSRSLASLRLRRAIARRHRRDPYDVVYQFSTIETPAVPSALRRRVPLVIHPETHAAGELRQLISERRLSLRCQPRYAFALVTVIMAVRTLVQRFSIRHAGLLVCISSVFRDHLVRDYGFPVEATVVIPNPIRIDRFTTVERRLGVAEPAVLLALGRVSARKGIEDVVSVSKRLAEQHAQVRIRVVGGPSLWSDYTKLLEDLPRASAEYCGPASAAEVPDLLRTSDLLLQASKYEPFALTVAEALASGVPVVATSEVGAIEGGGRLGRRDGRARRRRRHGWGDHDLARKVEGEPGRAPLDGALGGRTIVCARGRVRADLLCAAATGRWIRAAPAGRARVQPGSSRAAELIATPRLPWTFVAPIGSMLKLCARRPMGGVPVLRLKHEGVMLFIVIPAVWLVILGVVVSLCLTAARSDAAQAAEDGRSAGDRRVLWDGEPVLRLTLERPIPPPTRRREAAPSPARRPAARRRRVAAHGIR